MAKQEYTELVSPGKVRLYHKGTGKAIDVFPVDRNEIMAAEDSEYSDTPPKGSVKADEEEKPAANLEANRQKEHAAKLKAAADKAAAAKKK